jgi:hypothetical protein
MCTAERRRWSSTCGTEGGGPERDAEVGDGGSIYQLAVMKTDKRKGGAELARAWPGPGGRGTQQYLLLRSNARAIVLVYTYT